MSIIVVLKEKADKDSFLRELNEYNLIWKEFAGLKRHLLIYDVQPDTFIMREHSSIEAIEDTDTKIESGADRQDITVNNSSGLGNWALPRIVRRRAPWDTKRITLPFNTYYRCVREGAGVDIYIIDSGIITSHDEFGGRATNVYEAVSSGGAGDDNGHGTEMASCAAGASVGLARSSLLWSFKCLDSSNTGTAGDIIDAMSEAVSHYENRSGTDRPAVVNVSILGTSSTIGSAAADMITAGMVVCAAAGNGMENLDSDPYYPAVTSGVITVGGLAMPDIPMYTVRSDGTTRGTAYGSYIDIMAPAQRVRAANESGDSDYSDFYFGTSHGCAYTSGVVACMLEGYTRLADSTEVAAVKTQLLANATTGYFENDFELGTLPDKILYLDPNQIAPGPIGDL